MLFSLLNQSYWRDEAFCVMLAKRPLGEIFSLVVRFDHTPPLFYYLQHFWIGIFGDGEATMRSLSVIFHLLTVYFGWRLTKSKLAAFALLFNPLLWRYAVEARHYSAFTALILGAVYLKSASLWFLALLTHNFAWLYWLVWLMITKSKKLLWPGLAASPWLFFLAKQAADLHQEMWLKAPTITGVFNSLKVLLVSDVNYPVRPLLLGLMLILLIPVCFKPKRKFWLALLTPLLALIISRLWTPLFYERYFLPTTALLIICLCQVKRKLTVLLVLISLIAFIQINRYPFNPPMHQTAREIAAKWQPGEIVITRQPINFLEVYYYLNRLNPQIPVYSYLYPGEDHIPAYVGVDLVKPQAEILAVPYDRPVIIIEPDGRWHCCQSPQI
jgi:hypothetical protein